MKIKSIELKGNPIMGDIFFDFCDSNGIPKDSILIAGENGTGKSTLLNIIHDFISGHMYTSTVEGENEKRVFTLELNLQEVHRLKNFRNAEQFLSNLEERDLDVLVIEQDYSSKTRSFYFPNSRTPIKYDLSILDERYQILYCLYSDVEVNFTPDSSITVTDLVVDKNRDYIDSEFMKSTKNLATEITQLLINIEILDSLDYTNWAKENPDSKVNEGVIDKRMRRFTEAFNYMFPNKKFKKINENRQVIFEEFGKEMTIDKLSSGEKQIVFRGSFLLKNKYSTEGTIVLIDEPELSLHPKWQLKIMDFYRYLFTNNKGQQTSQIIAATHSPFVIDNKVNNKGKIIILNKNEDSVYIEKEPEFYGWTPKEAIIQAFDVNLDSSEEVPIIFVEGPTDEKYIKKAIELFKNNISAKIKCIGNKKGGRNSGEGALKKAKEYLLANSGLYNNKYLLLYDSDTNVKAEDFHDANLFIRRMPYNQENNHYRKGIENLITLPSDFNFQDFYITKENTDDYGAKTISQSLNKMKLCNYICEELTPDVQRIYLSKFEDLIFPIFEQFDF